MSSTHPAGKAPQDTGGEQSAGWLPGRPGRPDDEPRWALSLARPRVTVTKQRTGRQRALKERAGAADHLRWPPCASEAP